MASQQHGIYDFHEDGFNTQGGVDQHNEECALPSGFLTASLTALLSHLVDATQNDFLGSFPGGEAPSQASFAVNWGDDAYDEPLLVSVPHACAPDLHHFFTRVACLNPLSYFPQQEPPRGYAQQDDGLASDLRNLNVDVRDSAARASSAALPLSSTQ